MSSENIAIVQRFLEHVSRGEHAAALAYVDPAATLDWTRSEAPDSGTYRGHDAWRAWIEGRRDAMGEVRFEILEVLDVPPENVVTATKQHGRGRVSGMKTEAIGGAVWTLREDGRITRSTLYQTWADALAAVGVG